MAIDPVSLAITAAVAAINMAVTASRTIEGPRLKDTSASLADYGTPLNYFVGERILVLPCFFAKPIVEKKRKRKGKGGKEVSYSGFGTWASHVADQPITSIKKIWFDGHLVVDNTGSGAQIYPLSGTYDLEAHIRFYYGSEDQEPDPDMLAYIEARDGPGTCPAYRGTSYIYFENIPLELLGNRYPNVTVLAFSPGTSHPIFPMASLDTTASSQFFSFNSDYSQLAVGNLARYSLIDTQSRTETFTDLFTPDVGSITDGFALREDGSILYVDGGNDVNVNDHGTTVELLSMNGAMDGTSFNVVDGNGLEHWSARTLIGPTRFYFDGAEYLSADFMGGPFNLSMMFADEDGRVWVVGCDDVNFPTNCQFKCMVGDADPGQFEVTGLPGITDDLVFAFDAGPHFVLAVDDVLYTVNKTTGAVMDTYTPDFSSVTLNNFRNIPPGAATFWIGFEEISSADLSQVRILDARDWNPGLFSQHRSCVYDPINNALIDIAATDVVWYFLDQYDGTTVLADLINFVTARSYLDPDDIDTDQATQNVDGYNWITGSGRQIMEPMLDLMDVDARPHDFGLQFLARGGSSQVAIPTGDMVRDRAKSAPYGLKDTADSDLARRVFLIFADTSVDQNSNVAMPSGPEPDAAGSVREFPIDMSTFAAEPDYAQQLIERRLRRGRFGRTTADFSLTRQYLALEPGDVATPTFDDRTWTMRNTKLQIGANGVLAGDWERDAAAIAILSGSAGAASNQVVDEVPDTMESLGFVIDGPLIVDAHEQTAPFAYLASGPAEPGVWAGSDYAQSDTGELDSYAVNWDGIGSGDGSVIGTCSNAFPDVLPWVPDMGSTLLVTLNVGALTAATLEDLLEDETLNLVAIRSGTGWEYAQFMTPTLVGTLSYSITGWLRGKRGTEWAIAGHQDGDAFVLLDKAKIHTMGASEIGDTDYYVVSNTGIDPDEDDAFSELFTGAAHKPYAPVNGTVELDESSPGANDVLFDATRRTRLGGASLNGTDVPLGETAEAWSLDIMDLTSPAVVVRTINSSSLPIRYTEAMQIADWGAALAASSPIVIPEANLYQVSPPLTLRGYPLNFPEQTL